MNKKLWILDNGHGKDTLGKRSPVYDGKQLMEWEFTRDIVSRLSILLGWAGIECMVLVPEDRDVSLSERVRRANMWGDRSSVLVSIHANAGGGRGLEVFTSKGQTISDEIATVFLSSMALTFPEVRIRADLQDGDPDKEANFTVLARTSMPAILTENFFMDTEAECKKYLMTDMGRDLIALAHYIAIMNIEKGEISL